MLIAPEAPSLECRPHPWGVTEYTNGGGAYYDFSRHPELIRSVLEDFKPHAHQKAVQRFYDFLEWVATSPESMFETNDCALRAPHPHNDILFPPRFKIEGRLHIFYRNHADNIPSACFLWLQHMFCVYLQVYRPDFHRAIIGVSLWDTDYTRLVGDQIRGKLLNLSFYAYGDSEADAFDSLLVVFDGFWEAAKRISRFMVTEIPDFP